MNPEIFNDPQKFLWPFIHAREAQKQLEERQIEIEDNFVIQQAIIGWIIDNPWIFLLLLNRETKRLEGDSCAAAKNEIITLNAEIIKLKRELEAVKSVGKTSELRNIHGIGPVIETLLESKGISSFAELISVGKEEIEKILTDNNLSSAAALVSSEKWMEQAEFLKEGDKEGWKRLMDEL